MAELNMLQPPPEPDMRRCEARKPTGGPFIMGGEIGDPRDGYRVRCRNKPDWIATEQQPNPEDGKHGCMSLCCPCREVCEKQLGADFAFYELIENWKQFEQIVAKHGREDEVTNGSQETDQEDQEAQGREDQAQASVPQAGPQPGQVRSRSSQQAWGKGRN